MVHFSAHPVRTYSTNCRTTCTSSEIINALKSERYRAMSEKTVKWFIRLARSRRASGCMYVCLSLCIYVCELRACVRAWVVATGSCCNWRTMSYLCCFVDGKWSKVKVGRAAWVLVDSWCPVTLDSQSGRDAFYRSLCHHVSPRDRRRVAH